MSQRPHRRRLPRINLIIQSFLTPITHPFLLGIRHRRLALLTPPEIQGIHTELGVPDFVAFTAVDLGFDQGRLAAGALGFVVSYFAHFVPWGWGVG